jgi:NTE family protein
VTQKYGVGLVLSGGGARGFAHVGALRALNEHGIFPDVISAVSVGAIVGALYADGSKPAEIFETFRNLDIYKYIRLRRPMLGMLRAEGLRKRLDAALNAKTFEELRIPLFVSTTNFTRATTAYFSSGPLLTPILASSAIPLVLKPMLIEGELYVDGGLMNNLPVGPLEGLCNTIIGINVNPAYTVERFRSFRNYADRVMHLAIRANVKPDIAKCDLYLEPPGLMDYNIFKLSAATRIHDIGYQYTNKILRQMDLSALRSPPG